MKNIFKKVFVLIISIFVLFSFNNVFSAGFNDYINNIKESSEMETVIGACKNTCESGYYQLKFGLPFQKMSRCACVPLSQGVGALLVSFIQFLLSSVGVISVIILIIAGFMRAFSAGNMNTVKKANDLIKNAFIGLVAVIFSGSALAIINPDLVDLGIFSTKILKPDIVCVDEIKDKSDGTVDGYYTNPENKVRYEKNCKTVCYTPDNGVSTLCCTNKVCGNQCCESGKCNATGDACDGYAVVKTNYTVGGISMEYKNVGESYTSTKCSCGTHLGQSVMSCISAACTGDTFCSCQKPIYITASTSESSGNSISCPDSYYCAKKKSSGNKCESSYECLSGICDSGLCYPKCSSSTLGQACSNSLSDNISEGFVCAKNSSKTVKCYNVSCNNVGDGCINDSKDGSIKCAKGFLKGEGICK